MKKLLVLIVLALSSISFVHAYKISDYYSSDDLSDYYGTMKACTKDGSDNDCRNGNEYKFYLKMYDIYYLYKNKYKVTLDLPLIMAALYYGNEQMPDMFASNLNTYDRNSLKDENTVTNLDWEYDFKNDDCYTYLNANDNSYDMQILAKNMVTKKITYKCSGSDNEENSDNSSSNNDSSNDTSEQKSSSSSEKSNKNIAENKIFYIGDSWFELLKKYGNAKSSKSYFYAKTSKNADWVLTNYSSAKSEAYNGKSLKDTIPKDTSAFVVNFGLNGTSMWEKTQKLIDNIVKDYPGKTVYFVQTPHVGEQYSYGTLTASKMNSNIDKYNSKMKSYCSGKSGVEYINPTINIVSENGKGYLKESYASGTFHLNASGDKQWYKDIISGIKGNGSTTEDSDDTESSSDSSSSGDGNTATDVETSNYDTQLKCDSGTLDKDSISATYELDQKKYKEFLLEYIKLKYYTPGSEVKECSTSSGNNGSANTTVSKTGQEAIDKMNEIALAQVGKTGDTYESWYGMYADWCAMFVSWLFNQVGGLDKYIVSSAIAGEVPRAADSRGYGTWYEDECTDSSTVPKAGDIILYDPWIGSQTIPWPQNGNDKYYSSHIGYVYKVDDNKVYSVEGNGSLGGYNGVWKHEHSRKDCGSGTTQGINGYFRPNY